MATLTLTVCGTTYGGSPAGGGTNNFQADEQGNEGDKVYYRYTEKGWFFNATRVGVAYLHATDRSAIDSMGCAYKTEEEASHTYIATYYLWRYDARAHRVG